MKLANITLAPTIRKYNKENLVHDVITGLIIMAVSIPISMGYAQIGVCGDFNIGKFSFEPPQFHLDYRPADPFRESSS